MEAKKINKWIIILGILLVLAVGYIAIDKLAQARQAQYATYYNAGVAQGQQAVIAALVTNIQDKGYVQLTLPTQDNKTAVLTLVPYQEPANTTKK